MKTHILGNKLALGLATLSACIALPAQALHLSSEGSGQVLLFPYYTVNSDNQTLISIVNSTDRGKATRLFFREGRNSRVALELSIYLAPYDIWTASIFGIEQSGAANIVTNDNSCTVPELKTSTSLPRLSNGSRYAPFSNAAYTGDANDAGPDDLARTREGHFELIEMGEVIDQTNGSLTAITHGANGIPANCAQIVQAWELGGYWGGGAAFRDMAAPSGGIHGTAYLVDALGGTMQAFAADAIGNFSGRNLHSHPGWGQPTLANANSGTSGSSVNAHVFVGGAPVTLQYPAHQAIDAVSAVLMADEIHNEFVTGASVGGASEWVVTFPTKHFYTDVGIAPPIAPFTRVFSTVTSENSASAPVDLGLSAWTREGSAIDCIPPFNYYGCIIGVPPPLEPSRLNWASNVVRFNQSESGSTSSTILGSTLSWGVDLFGWTEANEGTFRMTLWSPETGAPNNQHLLRPDLSGRRLRGLPVQGFWVASYTNGQLTPGVLSNYSDAVRHQSRASLGP